MNSADEGQVKEADLQHKDRRYSEIKDVREILATKHGRNFLWRLLRECGAAPMPLRGDSGLWESSAKIHYNVGRLELGRFIAEEILTANPEAWLLMQTEAFKRGERDA